MSDLDCAAPERCFVGTDGVRLCNVPLCTPGRPFLVDGAARLARATRRDGWRDAGAGPDLGALSPEARSELARAWTDAALMEHASIAAFARFALELLAFGAPAELVERTSRALADETRHAEQAFRLASAYAASPIGPSRLPLDGSLGAIDLEASALTTFLEGCVGESVAALEAAEALAHATDPAVREVLARVAAEEAEHAELAFRFVKWALERRGQTLAPRLSRALCELLSEPIPSFEAAETALERELLGHGVLPASRRAAVRRAALRDVVAPCLGTLLEAANASIPRAPATLSPS